MASDTHVGTAINGVDTSHDLADSAGRYYRRFFPHKNGNTDRSTIAR